MTKYFLHGGMAGVPCESNDKYYKEILGSVSGPAKILLTYFAVEKERWAGLAGEHENKFEARADGREIGFQIASADPGEFAKQVEWCDVVYIRGGSTPMLQTQLEKVPDLQRLFESKVVAGSSAGALVFMKYYYDQDHDKILAGLDFLHAKMIAHYLSTGEYAATSGRDKLEMLEGYAEKLPVYAVKETEFVVVDIHD
ncbi:MAG: Type 1 glutamine amidotransferase-like domain-containing protein [Parcubacteria group bacterium]